MTMTVTGHYESIDQAHGAKDDLVATGIPQEKIYVGKDSSEIKVICPDTTVPEIREILDRHGPVKIDQQPLDDRT